MIVGNSFNAIGDKAIIQSDSLVIGLVSITGYSDTVIGETAERFFEKRFRYSINGGIIYSQWMTLTNENVSGITTDPLSPFVIEYEYKRAGTDATGSLVFESVQIVGEYIDVNCPSAYDSTIFAEHFECNSVEVIQWCSNVADKLYNSGIIADYVERGKTDSFVDDEDYIVLWKTVSCFFSLLVNLARSISNFQEDKKMIIEYLLARGLFVSDNDDITTLIYLMENYWREMAKRGTVAVFDHSDNYVGEFYRILRSDPSEVVISLPKVLYSGWFVDVNSPLYRGNYFDDDLIVGFKNDYIQSGGIDEPISGGGIDEPISGGGIDYSIGSSGNFMERYLISGSAHISLESLYGDSIESIVSDATTKFADAFRVNSALTYEITFWVKTPSTGGQFSLDLALQDGNNVIDLPKVDGSASGGSLIQTAEMSQGERWYLIRATVHAYGTPDGDSGNDTHTGVNVKFPKDGIFNLTAIVTVTTGVKLYDVKSRLGTRLNSAVNYSNAIQIYAKNNNDKYRADTSSGYLRYPQLENDIRYYLLSYKSTLIINWL